MKCHHQYRINKIKEQTTELENEITISQDYLRQITSEGLILLRKLTDVTAAETFLSEYKTAHTYFSKCISLVSDFNCSIEAALPSMGVSLGSNSSAKQEQETETELSGDEERRGELPVISGDDDRRESGDRLAKSPSSSPQENPNKVPADFFHVDLELGGEYEVVLTHLTSPGEFYVRMDAEEPPALQDLKERFRNLYAPPICEHELGECDNPERKKTLLESHGKYAVVHCHSSIWSRVEILDLHLEEKDHFISVLFIDYGTVSNVTMCSLRSASSFLKSYPRHVLRCHLSGLAPASSSVWSEETVKVFQILTESAEVRSHFIIDVTALGKESVGVRLLLRESKFCLNDQLVELGEAVEAP